MLSHQSRLRSSEVREILAKGRSVKMDHLTARYVITNEGMTRSAAVVSKKIGKTAVMRNTLRRALYNAIRKKEIPPSMHIVFFVQKIPKAKKYADSFITDLEFLCFKLSS